MYLLYSLLLTLGFIILLPRFAVDALRSGKYVTGLRERFGHLPLLKSKNEPVIWLHCVSVGEARAAQALVRALSEKFPAFRLVISTTTVTGQHIAREIFGRQASAIFYFPIDWAFSVRRVLRAIQPTAVLIMETELWPRLFRECRKNQIPVALLNGRISDRSFRRYKIISPFIRRVLNDLTFASMQSDQDAARIRDLGLTESHISVSGNLKFDSASAATNQDLTNALRERFGFDRQRPLIVAASTHAPEEAIVLAAFDRARSLHSHARLLFAPRHPERFPEVAQLLGRSGLTWVRRSDAPSENDTKCEAVLLDTIGEVSAVFPSADIVFVGGSISPHGGHNVLEPAAQGICTITGPHTKNFAAITKTMLAEEALIQLPETSDSASELGAVLNQLLTDERRRLGIGERARSVCRRNQGATERTIEIIAQLLTASSITGASLPFSSLQVTAAK